MYRRALPLYLPLGVTIGYPLTIHRSYIICILAATTLYFILKSENRKRESVPDDEAERAKLAFMDLTDKENPYFRYVL